MDDRREPAQPGAGLVERGAGGAGHVPGDEHRSFRQRRRRLAAGEGHHGAPPGEDVRELEPDPARAAGDEHHVAGADLQRIAGRGRDQLRFEALAAHPAHFGRGIAGAELREQGSRQGRGAVFDAQLDRLDQLVGALARQRLRIAGERRVHLVHAGGRDDEEPAGAGGGLGPGDPMGLQHRGEARRELRLGTPERRQVDDATDPGERVRRFADHRIVAGVLQELCQRVRDPERVAGQQEPLGQRVLGGSGGERRLEVGGRERQELAALARDLAQDGREDRSRRGVRLRDRALQVVDDLLDGGLRPEQGARQPARAGEGLVDVAVQLDRHQRVEAEVAGQGLRRLDRLLRERADARDRSQDGPSDPIVGGFRSGRGHRLDHRNRPGSDRGARRCWRGQRQGRKLRKRDAFAGERGGLLLEHLRLLLQQRDLFAEQSHQRIHLRHLLRSGRQPQRLGWLQGPFHRPVRERVERGGWQRDQPRIAALEERRGVQVHSDRPDLTERDRKLRKAVLLAVGESHVHRPLALGQRCPRERGEHAARAHLHPDAAAERRGGAERSDEVDRRGGMADPDLAFISGVGSGGGPAHYRHRRLRRAQRADQLAHGGRDALHQRRVEGMRDVERGDLDSLRREPLGGRLHSGGRPRDHRLAGVVQIRYRDALDPAHRARHHLGGSCGAGHRPFILEAEIDHRQPAQRDQPDCILGRENAGRCGGRKLTQAVPERHVAAHVELLQEAVQGEPDAGHRRLADLGRHQPALGLSRRLRVEEAAQRSAQPAVQIGDGIVELVEPFPESRKLLVRLPQEANPLCALPGEEQADLAPVERPLGEHRTRDQLCRRGRRRRRHPVAFDFLPLLQRLGAGEQLLGERIERVRHHREPCFGVCAPREGPGDVRERASFALQGREGGHELSGGPGHDRVTRSGDQEQLCAGLPWRRQAAPRRRGLRGFLQHHVRVGPTESERADARAPRRPVRLPGHLAPRKEERPGRKVQRRVLLGDARLGRQLPVVQRQRGLDQAGDPGGGHGVADVRLHAPERGARAVALRPARLLEQHAQGAHLDHVPDGGGGAVRFQVPDRLRRDARVAVGHPQRLELSTLPRSHRAIALAVVVRRGALHHGVDAVAVAQRIVEALEDHGAGAFAHHESVGLRVEGTALAAAGDGADAAEADQVVGQEVEVNASGDRQIDLACAQVDDGLLGGDERGRACRVDRERGAAEVPGLGHDRRRHVEQAAGHGERAHRHHVLDQ